MKKNLIFIHFNIDIKFSFELLSRVEPIILSIIFNILEINEFDKKLNM